MALKIISLYEKKTYLNTLFAHLKTILPNQSIIFSDMDSTLVFQTKDGFEETQKQAIRRYLDQGGTLVIVTGDSRPISEKEFINKLKYQGASPIYVINGSGFQITKYQDNQAFELFKGKEVSLNLRKKIVERLEVLFRLFFQSDVHLLSPKSPYLSKEGYITQITQPEFGILLNNQPLSAAFRLEVRSNKITLAFDGRDQESLKEYSLFRSQLIELIIHDPVIKQLTQSDNLHLVAGDHYIDMIRDKKEDGVGRFLSLTESKDLNIDQKHIITMGDSANDKGMLCFPYQTNQSIQRIFVGNKDSLFQSFQETINKKEWHYLKNMFIKGSEAILKTIGQNDEL